MRFIIIDINIDLNIQLRRVTIPNIPTGNAKPFYNTFYKTFLVYLQMILKSNLVVLTMVITSLTFVVAAVASSVAVNIFSLSRRLLKRTTASKWPYTTLSLSKWKYPYRELNF